MAGFFITTEGPDGAGKSTQIALMVDYLKEKGFSVLVTREPGGCLISEKIRDIILNPDHKEMDAVTEALLYAASRAQHVTQVIIPALKENKIVICDRFLDSSIAYQGYGRGLGVEMVHQINEPAVKGLKPHLTLLFALDPQKGLNRKSQERPMDRLELEKEEFHHRVYKGYMEIAAQEKERMVVIDASDSIQAIHEKIQKILNCLLKLER